MPRGGNRCTHTLRRYEFFEVIRDYAEEHRGSLPTQYNCWKLVQEAGYQINWSNFRAHFEKLKKEGYIEIDYALNVLYIPQSHWRYAPPTPTQTTLFR